MENTDRESKVETHGWQTTSIALPTAQQIQALTERVDVNWLPTHVRRPLDELKRFAETPDCAMIVLRPPLGLGDKVIHLRHVVGYARHFPDKQFFLHPEHIPLYGRFDLPSNVVVENKEPEKSVIPIDLYELSQPYERSGQMSIFRDLALMSALSTVTEIDVSLYDKPIVNLDENLLNMPPTHDVIIFPDAFEIEEDAGSYFKSQKSIDATKWRMIFDRLSKELRIALVIGTSHEEYCADVIDQADRSGYGVTVVRGNLDHVMNAILKAHKFVGMDSGTTHLAAQVIRAAQLKGRTIAFRELMAPIFSLQSYGITGAAFKTLNYQDAGRWDLDLRVSMSDIDPQLAADFIMS